MTQREMYVQSVRELAIAEVLLRHTKKLKRPAKSAFCEGEFNRKKVEIINRCSTFVKRKEAKCIRNVRLKWDK